MIFFGNLNRYVDPKVCNVKCIPLSELNEYIGIQTTRFILDKEALLYSLITFHIVMNTTSLSEKCLPALINY